MIQSNDVTSFELGCSRGLKPRIYWHGARLSVGALLTSAPEWAGLRLHEDKRILVAKVETVSGVLR